MKNTIKAKNGYRLSNEDWKNIAIQVVNYEH